MKEYAVIIGLLIVTIGIALWVVNSRVAPGGQACTQEAKICPDGSAVGRTGPNCEFAECPAVSNGGSGILPYNSGVQGTVSLGPTCPVQRVPPDPSCTDKPYATAITVYRAGSKTPFIIGNSDTTGAFKFSLPPGSYTLSAGNGKALPRCASVDATVGASGYATTSIFCDSGIR